MKKLFLVTLIVSLVLTGAFASAQKEQEVEKSHEITWLFESGNTPNEENMVLQKIEDVTGVKVHANHVPTGDFDSKLNTLIASKNLPDLFSVDLDDAAQFIEEGMLAPLDDLIEKYGPHIKECMGDVLADVPANQIDGHIYMLPTTTVAYMENLILRKDWLEKLGLEVPKTTDELFDVLYAFTYNDPDGNGKNDTTGIVMTMVTPRQWENIFGAFGVPYGYDTLLKDGTVTTYLKDEGFLDAIKYVNKLYHAGVMDADFATMPAMTANEKWWSGKVGALGFRSVGTSNNWYPGRYTYDVPADPADLFVVAQVAGPNGDCGSVKQYMDLNKGCVVSSTCENPEDVIKFLDYIISEEGDELLYLGVEDVMFRWIDKEQGKYERLGEYTDDSLHRANGGFAYWFKFRPNGIELGTLNAFTRNAQIEQQQYAIDHPVLNASLEATAKYGTTLNEIVKEAVANLVVTTGDIEAEYKAFVQRWEREGGLEYEKEATAVYSNQK